MDVEIKLLEELKPKDSILVCGLPGIAYVGKLSIDYLIRELKPKLIGEVYSSFFPPYVLVGTDGVVELLKNELYYLEGKNEKRIFFFTGNAQASSPEGQYYIADKILDTTIGFGVKRIYSIAALLTAKSFDKPTVYGVSTDTSLVQEIKKYGVIPMDKGGVSGMNGLIFGLSKVKGLEGICLLGETHGYRTATGHYLADARSVRSVLGVLTKMLDLTIDMEPLDKQTKKMDEIVTKIADIEKRVRDEMLQAADRDRTRYIR